MYKCYLDDCDGVEECVFDTGNIFDYKHIHKASICELILTPKFSTERETVEKQITDRKIKEKLEKIAMLRKEVENIKKTM